MSIEVKNLVKRFGQTTVCDHLNLHIPSGQLVALLGPSGSGKTSLLRIIAGLERPDAGAVYFNGEDTTHVAVRERNVGFVFQHYALFGHMSIFENVAFGLRVRPKETRPSEEAIRAKVTELLKLVQLDWIADRYPHQLSGGQRQRIALARALAVEPKVLLLDEPFGALDAKVRKELRRWLRRLHDEMHITSVFVTHDQEEAMEVADRIVVMNQGRIEQEGPPDEVYDHPATPFVLQFLGDVNLFHGRDHAPGAVGEGDAAKPAVTYVRPHEIQVLAHAEEGSLAATLIDTLTVGPNTRLAFRRTDGSGEIEVELSRDEYAALRDSGVLRAGHDAHLKPRRVRQFESGGACMNFQQLRSVREAARRGYNLTEVANALHTSQPGVSRQIRELEDELGVELFQRAGKRLTGLTPSGQQLLPVIERLLREAENLRQAARDCASHDTGPLSLAATHSQARYALPSAVRDFRLRFPKVTLSLHQGSPRQVAQMLIDGEADIGIATEALDQYPQLVTLPCYTWTHSVVVPPGHPLLDGQPLTLERLAKFPLITYDGGFTGRSHIDDAFAREGLQPSIVLSAMDADVIKTYVELGMGVGVVASIAFDEDRDRNLRALDAGHLFSVNMTRLAFRRGAFLRGYVYGFIETFASPLTRDIVEQAIAKASSEDDVSAA